MCDQMASCMNFPPISKYRPDKLNANIKMIFTSTTHRVTSCSTYALNFFHSLELNQHLHKFFVSVVIISSRFFLKKNSSFFSGKTGNCFFSFSLFWFRFNLRACVYMQPITNKKTRYSHANTMQI